MARFLRLRAAIVNLDEIAVIRPVGADTVVVVTTLGYTEYLEGEDAVALLTTIMREALSPLYDVGTEQLARAWLGQACSSCTGTSCEEWEE